MTARRPPMSHPIKHSSPPDKAARDPEPENGRPNSSEEGADEWNDETRPSVPAKIREAEKDA